MATISSIQQWLDAYNQANQPHLTPLSIASLHSYSGHPIAWVGHNAPTYHRQPRWLICECWARAGRLVVPTAAVRCGHCAALCSTRVQEVRGQEHLDPYSYDPEEPSTQFHGLTRTLQNLWRGLFVGSWTSAYFPLDSLSGLFGGSMEVTLTVVGGLEAEGYARLIGNDVHYGPQLPI